MTFPRALFLVFLHLKLSGHIDWVWLWVAMPLVAEWAWWFVEGPRSSVGQYFARRREGKP